MWKIRIVYSDKSKTTLTGKGQDIDLRLARKYYDEYASERRCTARYQQYPKKDYEEIDLYDKVKELEEEDCNLERQR